MRRILTTIVLSLGTLVILTVAPAYGQAVSTPPAERARTIFDYKKELSLSDEQEREIKTILENLNQEVVVTRAKLTLLEVEIGDLIKKEADVEQIRKKLREAAVMQVAIKLADIVATRKIYHTLSAEQLKRWRTIQATAATQK